MLDGEFQLFVITENTARCIRIKKEGELVLSTPNRHIYVLLVMQVYVDANQLKRKAHAIVQICVRFFTHAGSFLGHFMVNSLSKNWNWKTLFYEHFITCHSHSAGDPYLPSYLPPKLYSSYS